MAFVTFMPLESAENFRTESTFISIGSPQDDKPAWRVDHNYVHRAEFNADDERGMSGYVPFDSGMATAMVNFIEARKGDDILVHCRMGISRSAAVAKFVSEQYGHTLTFSRRGRQDLMAADRNVYESLKLAKMRLDANKNRPSSMMFFSRDKPEEGVKMPTTKTAIWHWWNTNDVDTNRPALKPEKMMVEPMGDGRFRISYWFSSGRATMIGYTDVEPH